MNKVLLTGRLTRDPEMRSLASGKSVTTFSVASNPPPRDTSRRSRLLIRRDEQEGVCRRLIGRQLPVESLCRSSPHVHVRCSGRLFTPRLHTRRAAPLA